MNTAESTFELVLDVLDETFDIPCEHVDHDKDLLKVHGGPATHWVRYECGFGAFMCTPFVTALLSGTRVACQVVRGKSHGWETTVFTPIDKDDG